MDRLHYSLVIAAVIFLTFYAADAQTPTCTPTNIISDGGFEAGGIPSTIWNDPQTSTNFGTPLCSEATCGTGSGAAPPRSGLIWAWFGGIPLPETSTLGQDVSIPAGVPASLHFWMRIGTVTAPFTDVLNVKIDNAVVQSYPEPAVAETAYTERVIDLTAFANGSVHNIQFEYIGPSSGTGSYVVDDVSLEIGPPCPTPCKNAATCFTACRCISTSRAYGKPWRINWVIQIRSIKSSPMAEKTSP